MCVLQDANVDQTAMRIAMIEDHQQFAGSAIGDLKRRSYERRYQGIGGERTACGTQGTFLFKECIDDTRAGQGRAMILLLRLGRARFS